MRVIVKIKTEGILNRNKIKQIKMMIMKIIRIVLIIKFKMNSYIIKEIMKITKIQQIKKEEV